MVESHEAHEDVRDLGAVSLTVAPRLPTCEGNVVTARADARMAAGAVEDRARQEPRRSPADNSDRRGALETRPVPAEDIRSGSQLKAPVVPGALEDHLATGP